VRPLVPRPPVRVPSKLSLDESLKFSVAVPEQLARETVAERMADPPAVRRVVAAPVRAVNAP